MSFVRYNTEDSVISSETVVQGLWSGNSDTLNSSSIFTASGYTEYYLDIYNNSPYPSNSSTQFNIQYGNLNGSGSVPINSNVPGYSPSRIIYGEYRNLIYGTETTNFSFDNGISVAEQIYIINISRANYKQAIHPGSFNLTLKSGSAEIKLTDDSKTTSLTRFIGENRVYYIISGSKGNAYTSSAATSPYYGMLLPDMGLIILDSSGSLSQYIQSTDLGTDNAKNNHLKLFESIKSGSNFQLQSEEIISSRYFFTRVKNSEFNYTTNPSIIDNNGNLLYTTLINNPQTFPTTIGMYNDNNELLAVAKMSKPLTKDFSKEALIRIKLEY